MARKTLNTYAAFTAEDLKTRAELPGQSYLSVVGSSVECEAIPISQIRSVITEPSNKVTVLCGSSRVNKWSNFGPREFYLDAGVIYERIKTPSDLTYFLGYNHDAPSPWSANGALQYTQNAGSGFVTASVAMKIKLGEYDWSRINGATHCKVIIYNTDGQTVKSKTGLIALSTNNGNFLTFQSVNISVATGSIGSFSYPTSIWLCQADGNELAKIPDTDGSITVDIIAAIKHYMVIDVAGNIKTWNKTGDAVYGASTDIHQSFRYTGLGLPPNARTLTRIEYEIVNATTNEIVSTTTITSFNIDELPLKTAYEYNVNDTETFYASMQRVTPSAGQFLRVKMYYE